MIEDVRKDIWTTAEAAEAAPGLLVQHLDGEGDGVGQFALDGAMTEFLWVEVGSVPIIV